MAVITLVLVLKYASSDTLTLILILYRKIINSMGAKQRKLKKSKKSEKMNFFLEK